MSILDAMRAALTASTNLSYGKTDYTPLTYVDVFYLATLGGAKGELLTVTKELFMRVNL